MLYIVQIVRKWDSFEPESPVRFPFPLVVSGSPGSIGFCEVFDDFEAALEAADGEAERVGLFKRVGE